MRNTCIFTYIHAHDNTTTFVIHTSTTTDAKTSLETLLEKVRAQLAQVDHPGQVQVGELVIDGKTLSYVLGSDLEEWLAEIGASCGSVIICRASPSQKAAIVKMMMEYEMRTAQGVCVGGGVWGAWFC